MRGLLRFIIIAAVLLGVVWWLGNLPGTVVAHAGKYTVQTSVPAALLLLFLLALVFTFLLRLGGGVRRAPGGFLSWRGGRRQRLGEIATQRGIVALAAGDAAVAQAEAVRARKLLGDAPLALLLAAESARLSGRTEEARAAFEQLTTHKDMAFLGHRGLLRHTMESGDHDAAATHAVAAEASYPRSSWLQNQRLDLAVKQRNWPLALSLTRQPAEIAAFAAAAAEAAGGKQAVGFGKQAVRADPALAPGVVAYANALFAANKPRAARQALRAGWAAAPHPLIAQAWLAPAATPLERAQAAAELAAAKPGHSESELLLAQTALAANLTGEARRHAEAALAAGNEDGRAASVLSALNGGGGNALVPVSTVSSWVCTACHTGQAAWAPVCPVCQKAGTLVWGRSRLV